MLFWLFVILIVVGIGLCVWGENSYSFEEFLISLGIVTSVLSFIIALVMGFVIFIDHINVDATIAENNTRYEMLVYQYENDIYDNDNDLGKRELIKDIQEWNEDLAYKKEIQDNFWLGVFYPDIYDQFEFIELGAK